MGTAIIVPGASDGTVLIPLHSNAVTGANHRYATLLDVYAVDSLYPTIHDAIGSADLTAITTPANLVAAQQGGFNVARLLAAPTTAVATQFLNSGVDVDVTTPGKLSFSAVMKVPNANSTVINVDGFNISRAGNKNYSMGGSGAGPTTAGAQTDEWAVFMAVVDTTGTSILSVNGVEVTSTAVTAPGTQNTRILWGAADTRVRALDSFLAEINTWPFMLSVQQRADHLAAMRAAYPFVPQS